MDTWCFSSCDMVREFLPSVANVLEAPVTICIEHSGTTDLALEHYHKHLAEDVFWPLRDTIKPHTHLYYCALSEPFVHGLIALLERTPITDMIWHMKGYDEKRLIFYSHDVDCGGDILVSGRLEEGIIQGIAEGISSRPGRIDTQIDWETVQVRQ